MKTSKEIIKAAGLQPRLRLGIKKEGAGMESTGPHRVKLLQDKIVPGTDPRTGKQIEYVRYLLEEKGEKKVYQTKKLADNGDVSYLVQRLAEIDEGQEVILEMKKRGPKNYVEVLPVKGTTEIEIAEDDHDEDESDVPDIFPDTDPLIE